MRYPFFSKISRLKGKSIRDLVIFFRARIASQLVVLLTKFFGREYVTNVVRFLQSEFRTSSEGWSAYVKSNRKIFFEDAITNYQLNKNEDTDFHLADLLNRNFSLLGSQKVNLDLGGGCIDWHVDFVSGYKWGITLPSSRAMDYVFHPGADIKIPWELSRFQHLPFMALYAVQNKKENVCQDIICQIEDWIAKNPICFGPNWACTMDVSIRLVNWLVALDILKKGNFLKQTDERGDNIYDSLMEHVWFILNHSEYTSKLTSNHYVSNIAALYFASTLLPNNGLTNVYKFSRDELRVELSKQFRDDGFNHESSSYYHRLVLEMFGYCEHLARLNGLELFERENSRLELAFDCIDTMLDSKGYLPQFGDNDSGIFIRFYPRDIRNCSYLRALGNALFPEKYIAAIDAPETVLLSAQSRSEDSEDADTEVYAFENSGIFSYYNRKSDIRVHIFNSPNGQEGNGGHCHNDKLSFTLSQYGELLFDDPGTGVYTADPRLRDSFRSTSNHNTVCLPGEEQNRFPLNKSLFSLVEDVKNPKGEIEKTLTGFRFEGSHDGYCRLGQQFMHKRVISFDERQMELTIVDEFTDSVKEKTANFIYLNQKYNRICGLTALTTPRFTAKFRGAEKIVVNASMHSKSYGYFNLETHSKMSIDFRKKLTTTISLRNHENMLPF